MDTAPRIDVLEMVTMGCAWRVDVSALEAADAAATARRWQRAIALADTSDTPLLDPEQMIVRALPGPVPAPTDGEIVVGAHDPARLPYALSREVTRAGLTRMRDRATLLHAAVLADAAGRALALVAASGGGKSTATRVLATGLGYVSDESLVLLDDHRIAPHPKPPSLVVDRADPFHKEEPAPDVVGFRPTPAAPRLAALLTLARDEAVGEPFVEEVGLLDQLLTVLPETSSVWCREHGLDRLARAVTAGGVPSRLHYAEIEACRDLVHAHLAAAAPATPSWEHLPPGDDRWTPADGPTHQRPEGAMDSGDDLADELQLARGPWSDAIAIDGEVLVLAGPRPLRLAGPGAVIWRAAEAPRAVAELTTDVVAELGEHPDAGAIVREAAGHLLRHGALRRA